MALTDIGNLAVRDPASEENESKMRLLGGHTAVFQVVQKHVGCLKIQTHGMRVLGLFSCFMPTKELLGDIGYVEVILARMEQYPDSCLVQKRGCLNINNLVKGMKVNAERVEKSGGIAMVIAAMKAHPTSYDVQQYGCHVLSDMGKWEEYRPLIARTCLAKFNNCSNCK